MIKNKNVAFGLFVIFFLVFWNLFDFLYTVLISKGSYRFASGSDLIIPLGVAVASGYLFFLRKKNT